MPRVSAKRQITLPIDQYREVGIGPGDEYRSYVADGRITIVRKTAVEPDAAAAAIVEVDASQDHVGIGDRGLGAGHA